MKNPIAAGNEARRELEYTKDAFEKTRQHFIDQTMTSTTPEEAFNGVCAVQVLDNVQRQLFSVIDTGRIAEAKAKREEALKPKK